MKAIRIHQYGGPDVMLLEECTRPLQKPKELLIRVWAAGVNPVDAMIRDGRLLSIEHKFPLILGWDVSGEVANIGENVTGFQPGDQVYAYMPLQCDGAYAEYTTVDAKLVARKPASLDHVHAAGVPICALTAWQALDKAEVTGGQTVLVQGATGGVGSFVVQLAKARGATVVGTAGPDNQDVLRDLGVDQAIDYTAGPIAASVRDVDAVIDTFGGSEEDGLWAALKPGGCLVTTVGRPSRDPAITGGRRGSFVSVQPNAEQLTQIAQMIDSGQVKPLVSTVLPLIEARRAHQMIASHHTRGKIVLQVRENPV